MACVAWPRNDEFQRPNMPRSTGRFSSSGALTKWLSMACAPSRNSRMIGKPYWSDRGSTPTALCTLNRPPTQSQKPKTFAGSIPKAAVASKAELQATCDLESASVCVPFLILIACTGHRGSEIVTTCCRTMVSSSALMPFVSHAFMVLAFNMVSAVVNVLLTMITRVVYRIAPVRTWWVGGEVERWKR